MTEDEAKTKWCFAFTASHTDPRAQQSEYGIEQGLPKPFVHHCIAADCMAWRTRTEWLDVTQQEPNWIAYSPYAHDGDPEHIRQNGYCGLAGILS